MFLPEVGRLCAQVCVEMPEGTGRDLRDQQNLSEKWETRSS